MKLMIDGIMEEHAEGSSLLDVLRRRGDPEGHVLVELNGRLVRLEDLGGTFPSEGDRVEVILPAIGG